MIKFSLMSILAIVAIVPSLYFPPTLEGRLYWAGVVATAGTFAVLLNKTIEENKS